MVCETFFWVVPWGLVPWLFFLKKVAGADYNQSIADIYKRTGVRFDFSGPVDKWMDDFLRRLFGRIIEEDRAQS